MGSINKEKVEDPLVDAMLVSFSSAFIMVFQAALELKLFEIIAEAGHGAHVSSSVIASRLPTLTRNPEAASRLDRMLRLLASHSLLTCSWRSLDNGGVERLYGLTPTSQFFAGTGDGGVSLASVAALNNHRATVEVGFNAKDAILEGGNQFEKCHGMSIFEYMNKDPKLNTTFNQAMAQLSTVSMAKVLETYKGFQGLTSLVDVAGGTGKCLSMIISKYPTIRAINFDLPHVIHTAPTYPGIQHVAGDMFSAIPKADAVMIKDTLHNWNDEHCIQMLKNCYDILPNKGKVIVITLIMPETPEPTPLSMLISRVDSTMLLQPGGRERTEKEFEVLGLASGFSSSRLVCVAHSLFAVMEFQK